MTANQVRPASMMTRPAAGYTWQARPANIWVAIGPHNKLQAHVLRQLRARLEEQGCLFTETPDTPTPLGPVAHLAIAFAASYDDEILPTDFLTMLPKPRGIGLVIATVERIPDGSLFDVARGLLVKKSGHIGMVVEGDPDSTAVKRVLWASMAGNHRLLEGPEAAILDSAAFRVQAHVGAEKLAGHEGDDDTRITWEAWCASHVHQDMAQAARAMGAAGLIEDEVPLDRYGSAEQVRGVLRFLNRSALGEGMRSQLDPALRVMGVTTTGGGKVNLSPDPWDGQIVPIGAISWTGYIRAMPKGCPITFSGPSVETHENALVYLASALVGAGLVNSFDSFMAFLGDHFSRHDTIDILPEGMQPRALAIEHFHRQPRAASIRNPEKVEIVYPDPQRFPEVDFPCGVREAELHLLSALFRSKMFSTAGTFDRLVLAVLPGHGTVAVYGGPRAELTDMLANGMEMEPVVRV